jgi:mRNA interferase MazF
VPVATRSVRIHSPGDVVIVPFPFTDREAFKRRPALVCSAVAHNRRARHVILAMITTAAETTWPGDVPIRDLVDAGLPAPSVVRWKLFILDASLILQRAGALSRRDRAACRAAQPLAL